MPGHTRWWARSTAEAALPPLVVICGATATGKTALSLALAERLPGAEIVSADSRQVYRGLDIGTAKATPQERARIPHHGLDLVDPDEAFTAADYQQAATQALQGIRSRGGVALLVGGTGLYLRAVARGLPLAETGRDPNVRAGLEQRLAGAGLHTLVTELRAQAPGVAQRIDLANSRRVVRALERIAVHGDRPPPAPRGYPARSVWIGLQLQPSLNAQRIEERARAQFEGSLLDEARRLRERHDPGLPSFSALGYREAFAVLDGQMTVDEAIDVNTARNRRLARRQRTWFRAEPDVRWLDAAAPDLLDQALAIARTVLPGEASDREL